MTRLRRVRVRLSSHDDRPAVVTLDDSLWERVGRFLVARGRLGQRELDSALAEYRRTRVALDELLVNRGLVSRQAVASAVLVVQLGDELEDQLRERRALAPAPTEAFPDVPCEPVKVFALACLAVDAVVFAGAVVVAAIARSDSTVAMPSAAWLALFGVLSLGLYWGWRALTLETKLRPWADALLVAGSTGLAALAVLTISSLAGKTGLADELLSVWAFATVYGVAGRFAFYLAWPVRAAASPAPADAPRPRRRIEPVPSPAPAPPSPPRSLEVVPIRPARPDLSALLAELLAEMDAVARERAAS